jgi:hypothetical protein
MGIARKGALLGISLALAVGFSPGESLSQGKRASGTPENDKVHSLQATLGVCERKASHRHAEKQVRSGEQVFAYIGKAAVKRVNVKRMPPPL